MPAILMLERGYKSVVGGDFLCFEWKIEDFLGFNPGHHGQRERLAYGQLPRPFAAAPAGTPRLRRAAFEKLKDKCTETKRNQGPQPGVAALDFSGLCFS